ncbi:MAG: hypothetical protein MUF65_03855 [Rubritepida sp.]|nr:hypothetical protein [Rubritepida sp.]MCU0944487.1 hypothetical protein [Rubritepida sp.]
MTLLWAALLILLLPAGLFALVYGAMALAAIPLTLLLVLFMPARWRRGLPLVTVFMAAMMLAPVLLMAGLAAGALAGKPLAWEPIEWRRVEHARLPSDTWRHLFPMRPPGGGG